LIALTGYARESDRRRSREQGFDEHFVKPIDIDTLDLALRSLGPPRS
jgi:CheY-like chemotaxis protein